MNSCTAAYTHTPTDRPYDAHPNTPRDHKAFFDTTPLGRILNRFSKDTYTVDETLMPSIYMYLQCMTAVLGTIIVIGTRVRWQDAPRKRKRAKERPWPDTHTKTHRRDIPFTPPISSYHITPRHTQWPSTAGSRIPPLMDPIYSHTIPHRSTWKKNNKKPPTKNNTATTDGWSFP